METLTAEKTKKHIVIDDIVVPVLPDCPKCGLNQWHVTGTGKFLICQCEARYFNRNKV
jgi:hypothetical protein